MERVGEGTVVRKEADREEVGDLVQLAAGRGVIVKVVQLVASPETKRAKRVELSLLPSREPSPQLRNQARARTPRILSHFGLAGPLPRPELIRERCIWVSGIRFHTRLAHQAPFYVPERHVVQRFQLRFPQEIAFAATVGHAPLFQI